MGSLPILRWDKGDESSDWDHDGYSNYDEVYIHGTNPRMCSAPPGGDGVGISWWHGGQ